MQNISKQKTNQQRKTQNKTPRHYHLLEGLKVSVLSVILDNQTKDLPGISLNFKAQVGIPSPTCLLTLLVNILFSTFLSCSTSLPLSFHSISFYSIPAHSLFPTQKENEKFFCFSKFLYVSLSAFLLFCSFIQPKAFLSRGLRGFPYNSLHQAR